MDQLVPLRHDAEGQRGQKRGREHRADDGPEKRAPGSKRSLHRRLLCPRHRERQECLFFVFPLPRKRNKTHFVPVNSPLLFLQGNGDS